ncbi:glycosyltransferase [Gammaproteobacteria bacterium]|jgi:glycosyltransferase involved in cell wall biosynthesis|nr:glycosyltransferase [Gammaproteobacteria bacterium]
MTAKLSILIPAYNRPEHLDALLFSLVSQKNKDLEIIVSDDCSPKKNEINLVIDKFKNSIDNFIYYTQETNLGEVGNKNFLYKKASGKFLLYIGDDDLFENDAIKYLLELINNNHDNDVFILGHTQEDDQGRFSKNRSSFFSYTISGKSLINFGAINYDWFPFHFGHPASYIFRNSFDNKIIFNNDVGFAEDLAHLSHFLLSNKLFYFTNKRFFKWRKDITRNQTNQSNDDKLHIESRFLLLNYINSISNNYPQINLKLKERRFLFCIYKERKSRYFIRLINIVEILINYLQISLYCLCYLPKKIWTKKSRN